MQSTMQGASAEDKKKAQGQAGWAFSKETESAGQEEEGLVYG
jgi:hypothetical protein